MQREKNAEFVLRTLRETNWEFQNLIIWKKRTSAVPVKGKYGKQYQVIVYATKGDRAKTFHRLRINPPSPAHFKVPRENGIFVTDVWDDIRELTSGYFAGDEALRTDDGERFHKQQAPLALRNHRIVCPLDPWTNKGKKWLLDDNNITDPTLQFLLQENDEAIEFLNKKIDLVTSRMKSAVANDEGVKQLLEQPGIGIITAITMRAIIGHFDRFRTGKQLAHFAGVSPRNHSSAGKTTTGGLIKAGDELLRKILIEAAHRLKRHDKKWKAMAERLRANGKPGSVIAAAVANRWVRWLFRQMVDPNRLTAAA
jgi:hypothetical protein